MARDPTTPDAVKRDGRPKRSVLGFLGAHLSRAFPVLGAPGGYALVALYAATVLLTVVLAVAVVGAILRAVSDGPRAAPSIQAQFRWQDPPEIRLAKAGRTEDTRPRPPGAEAQDVGGAVVRWREEEKLRRAAGVLLIDDDYEGAMELLLQVKGEDSRAFALDRAAHGKILGRLQPALLREREALGACYERMRKQAAPVSAARAKPDLPAAPVSAARAKPDLPAAPVSAARAEPPHTEPLLLEDFLALPPQKLHLPQCAAALPERVALCFIRNVHVRLARATGANDTLLALVLGLGFPQGSDAARVYWEGFPEDYVLYDEVLQRGKERSGK